MIFHGLDDKGAPTLLIISLLSYSVEWTNSDMFFIAIFHTCFLKSKKTVNHM